MKREERAKFSEIIHSKRKILHRNEKGLILAWGLADGKKFSTYFRKTPEKTPKRQNCLI